MFPTRYASFFKRLVAHLVDVLLGGLFVVLVSLSIGVLLIPGKLLMALFRHLSPFNLFCHPLGIFDFLFGAIPVTITILWIIAAVCSYWLYFAIFESSPRQATPGKMIMGIFVTGMTGGRISFLRALGRTLGKVISQMFCYLGYLLALFTERNQALHDLLADTMVLEPDYGPPPMVSHFPARPPGSPGRQANGPGMSPPPA